MATIRPRRPEDDAEWLRMRCALWPEESVDGHRAGMRAWMARPDAVVLVAERAGGDRLAGFAEVATRPYADGCDSSPVAFLEGWFVDDDVRRQGIGAALVQAAEAWAGARGLTEFASDALLANDISHRAHLALGFEEVERAIRYRKPVTSAARHPVPAIADLLDAAVDAWTRHNQALVNLARLVPPGGLQVRAGAGSPTVAEMFTHMHHERMVSVLENAPEWAGPMPAAEWRHEPDVERLVAMLIESRDTVAAAVRARTIEGRGLDEDFAHPIQLVHFLTFHEGYHHGQIKLALKLAGAAVSDKDAGPLTWRLWRRRQLS